MSAASPARRSSEPTVVLSGSEPMFLAGLAAALERRGYTPLPAETPSVALFLCDERSAALAMLDYPDDLAAVVDLCVGLRRRGLATMAFFFADVTNDSRDDIYTLLRTGSACYLPKSVTEDQLFDAIATVERGLYFVHEDVLPLITEGLPAIVRRELPERGPLPLTPRQLELLRLVAEGKTNEEAARSLGLSPKTVKTVLRRVFRKLGVRNRTEAARLYLEKFRKR